MLYNYSCDAICLLAFTFVMPNDRPLSSCRDVMHQPISILPREQLPKFITIRWEDEL